MRPKYHDLTPGDFDEQLAQYAYCELKYDGLYAEFVGNDDGWSIHGRNGALLRYGHEPCPDCYLRGEMIEGTEWARGSEMYGSFVAWDCIYSGETAPASYADQRVILFSLAGLGTEPKSLPAATERPSVSAETLNAERLWKSYVLRAGYEGLIFRSADGQRYGRMKRVMSVDYVCTGVQRQGQRVTAIYGGLWIDGILETVCTVPVRSATAKAMTGDFVGRVFEAKGNAVMKSGALRHPRQAGKDGAVKWRADKGPEECML